MENPSTWGPAEKVIRKAMAEHQRAIEEWKAGLSLPRRIADALREAGLLREGDDGAAGTGE